MLFWLNALIGMCQRAVSIKKGKPTRVSHLHQEKDMDQGWAVFVDGGNQFLLTVLLIEQEPEWATIICVVGTSCALKMGTQMDWKSCWMR